MINSAYRIQHQNSWTNEFQLLAGDRIDHVQLESLIEQQNQTQFHFVLLIAELHYQMRDLMVGCIAIESQHQDVEIGTFCIAPEWQNLGYGAQVLSAAEAYALKMKPDLRYLLMWYYMLVRN